MELFKQVKTALVSYWDAIKLIFSSTLWLAFLVPLGLSIGLYFGGEILMDNFKDVDLSNLDEKDGSQFLLVGLQAIGVYMSVFMTKYLVLTLLTPILTPLSTRVEYLITGNTYPLIFKHYVEDIVRAWKIIGRNMIFQLAVMGIYYIVSFIYSFPKELDLVVYYLVAFYFYGFSFMDYPNERRRLSIPASVKFTRKYFLTAFVLGGVYGGMMMIPYIGVVIAPILAVVAGTFAVHHLVDLKKNEFAIKAGEKAVEEDVESAEVEELDA